MASNDPDGVPVPCPMCRRYFWSGPSTLKCWYTHVTLFPCSSCKSIHSSTLSRVVRQCMFLRPYQNSESRSPNPMFVIFPSSGEVNCPIRDSTLDHYPPSLVCLHVTSDLCFTWVSKGVDSTADITDLILPRTCWNNWNVLYLHESFLRGRFIHHN